MRRDNRPLTIMQSARAHMGAGNIDVAIAVLTQEIDALLLKARAESRSDRDYHLEVRRSHSHRKVEVGQEHYHFTGGPITRMLPIVMEGVLLEEETIRGGNDPWLEEGEV